MKVLIACEESQAVCIAFRELGHEAYSCDLQPTSGIHPEWHYQEDVFKVIDKGWDMMIAFPPCTHLAVSDAAWFEEKIKDGRQQEGIDFFMKLTQTKIERWAIENPVGIMSNIYRKPDQIIHPYYFGDEASKPTCLWLNNLPKLIHCKENNLFEEKTHVFKGEFKTSKSGRRGAAWNWWLPPGKDRAKLRSKTFPGIAHAMATQWSNLNQAVWRCGLKNNTMTTKEKIEEIIKSIISNPIVNIANINFIENAFDEQCIAFSEWIQMNPQIIISTLGTWHLDNGENYIEVTTQQLLTNFKEETK